MPCPEYGMTQLPEGTYLPVRRMDNNTSLLLVVVALLLLLV